jgi:hypothetical protein
VSQGTLLFRRAVGSAPGSARPHPRWQAGRLLLALAAIGLGASACGLASARQTGPLLARTRPPAAPASVVAGGPGKVSAEAAAKLFASAPVVILANSASRPALAAAVRDARHVHAPLLLAWRRPGSSRAAFLSRPVQAEIKALRASVVLAVGLPASALTSLPHITIVTSRTALPVTKSPVLLPGVAVLVQAGDASAGTDAAVASAQVAGAQVIHVRGYDPRADPAAITTLSTSRPTQVIAVGAKFGPAPTLAARVAVALTGVQLPGGGQVLFPGHRLVALYGDPESPALGALGEQDVSASIARVRQLAALYRPLSRVPVVPTFEIIASVAQGTSEPEGGTYSYVTPVSQIRPWVNQATAAGMYVVLDLQAGRASLLTQARYYRSLLMRPNVGLALDPEWKLTPSELPLQQIGSVSSAQVNAVISWLARLTASHHLPQKLLVLHQFQLTMIHGEQNLDTRHDDLAIVIHMDGQGSRNDKEQTWDAVLGAAPRGVYFGWKNFFTKDHPMLTPDQTMARTPQPVMISYQ